MTHSHRIRFSRLLPVLLFAPVLFAGCGPVDDGQPGEVAQAGDTQSGGGPEAGAYSGRGNTVFFRLGAEPPNLNPYLESSGAYSVLVVDGNVGQIYQQMVRWNPKTVALEPELAESWEISEDHLTYTFHIREGVTFSDGEPLTAHDVKFTIDALLDPKNDTADIRSYLNNIESVEVPDDYTVVVHCNKAYFGHLAAVGNLFIYPKHLWENVDFNTDDLNRNPVGSGPYVFEEWRTGSYIALKRREDYWGEKPPVEGFHYKVVTDDNAAMIELQRGDFDIMRFTSTEDWLRRANTPEFLTKFDKHLLWSPVDGYLGTYGWIGWNAARPQFADKRVRQAMTMLLDRERILDTIYNGIGRITTGFAFPDSDDYDKTIDPWPYDPDAAQALLDEAGWVDANNDGIRERDGVDFRFEWIYVTGITAYDQMGTFYKEALERAGIEVTLRPLEWSTFLESVYKRDFDANMMAWVSPPEIDPYQIWHSSQAEKGSNYVNFNNPEADRIIEEARLTFDKDERAALFRQLHAIVHEEQPYTFTFNRQRMVAVSKRFTNTDPYPLGFVMSQWELVEQ